jgi:hypothetical protein
MAENGALGGLGNVRLSEVIHPAVSSPDYGRLVSADSLLAKCEDLQKSCIKEVPARFDWPGRSPPTERAANPA